MNRVEPLDESVGTNSTALMESPEVEEVQVKDVPPEYVNLEDNRSVDDVRHSVDTLEKTESVRGDNESVIDKNIFSSERSISDRKPESLETESIEQTENVDNQTEDEPKSEHIEDKSRARIKPPVDSDEEMTGGSRCCFGVLALLVQILLHGELALTLYWIIQYRWDPAQGLPFAFRGELEGDLEKEWNLHPVLMITGFIYCMGQAMLVYRSCRCCRRIWSKLIHTMFHLMAVPCIVIGFMAAWDYHARAKPEPIPHMYSIHSWLGLTTMAMFLLQFVSGVFSFLLLICCSSATASFRSSMVPIHSSLGTTTFLLAVATCIAGITETALEKLSETGLDTIGREVITELGGKYMDFSQEAIFLNTMGAILIALAILIPCIIGCQGFRKGLPREGEEA